MHLILNSSTQLFSDYFKSIKILNSSTQLFSDYFKSIKILNSSTQLFSDYFKSIKKTIKTIFCGYMQQDMMFE